MFLFLLNINKSEEDHFFNLNVRKLFYVIELVQIEYKLTTLNLDAEENRNALNELQLLFVDKIEAFYQQVYATISSYISLISIVKKPTKYQVPIRSVSKFLEWCNKNNQKIKEEISLLIKSIEFRSHFIDHPQQHLLHEWMTFSYIKGTCIIYFIRKGNEVYSIKNYDPYDPSFIPPVNCESFYVSPPTKEVFLAVFKFVNIMMIDIN